MDTSWWLALAAVVLLALVATLIDGWGRGAARRRRLRGRRRGGPQPGEIWWAFVPYEDGAGPGGKDRPCLVLDVHGSEALVAKITSKYHDERPGVIALPPGSVGDAQGRASFLETGELREVAYAAFRRRAGQVDPAVWDQVRHLGR
jgi:hypothetical protein